MARISSSIADQIACRAIAKEIQPWLERAAISAESVELQEQQVALINLPNGVSCIRVPFAFKTTSPTIASCTAAFKVVRTFDGKIKVFTVTTAIQALDELPWKPLEESPAPSQLPEAVDVLVVGGGHGGLSISAYLKALGLKFLCVDREVEVGDAWAKRYDSAQLHTTKLFSGLPYRPFPADYPEYVPAKLVAQYYRDYARDFGLPVFCAREVVQARQEGEDWHVELSTGEKLQAMSLIFAIGVGGRYPYIPDIPGQVTGMQLNTPAYKLKTRIGPLQRPNAAFCRVQRCI